jgi:hypothetical protein
MTASHARALASSPGVQRLLLLELVPYKDVGSILTKAR